MTKPKNRRKTPDRRKDDTPAWVLAAGIAKDRRTQRDRRSSKNPRERK